MKPNRKHVKAIARTTGASRASARRSIRNLAAAGVWLSSVHYDRATGETHTRWIRGTRCRSWATYLLLLRAEGCHATPSRHFTVTI
jgi:hypothetical protein